MDVGDRPFRNSLRMKKSTHAKTRGFVVCFYDDYWQASEYVQYIPRGFTNKSCDHAKVVDLTVRVMMSRSFCHRDLQVILLCGFSGWSRQDGIIPCIQIERLDTRISGLKINSNGTHSHSTVTGMMALCLAIVNKII